MQRIEDYQCLDKALIKYKEAEHIRLLRRWLPEKFNHTLKTDFFEEAVGEEEIFKWLEARSIHITGIDISSNIVKKAKTRIYGAENKPEQNSKNIDFIVSDIRNVALRDSVYDLAVSTSTLDHFPEIDVALKEIYRILKPDGLFFLTLHNKYNPFFAAYVFILSQFISSQSKRYRYFQWKSYTAIQIKMLLETAGFIPIDSAYIVHIFPPVPSLIWVLRKSNLRYALTLIEKIISLLKAYSKGNDKFLTGWFVAFLAKKRNR